MLEILVVVALMGIIIGMAVLAIGDGGRSRTVQTQARHLKAAFAAAAQESVMGSCVLGASIDKHGYRFYRLARRTWIPFRGDPGMDEAKLPAGLSLTLHVQSAVPHSNGAQPQIFFMANGEMSPFQITVADRLSDARYRITGAANGVLDLKAMEAEQ